MKITVTPEEALQLTKTRVDRLYNGVSKLQKSVETQDWKGATEILKALPSATEAVAENVKELSLGKSESGKGK